MTEDYTESSEFDNQARVELGIGLICVSSGVAEHACGTQHIVTVFMNVAVYP